MKQALFVLIVLHIVCGSLNGQHCPYDGSQIMTIKITPDQGDTIIPNLELTLLDSNGIAMKESKAWASMGKVIFQNPPKTADSLEYGRQNPIGYWVMHYWFAKDNYVLVLPYNEVKGKTIRIADIDGKANQGNFQTTTIKLSEENFYPLCTDASNWYLGAEYSFVENYKPIRVKLKMK